MSPTIRRLLMALCLLAAAGFARLGVWQLGRLQERKAENLAAIAALAAPVVTLAGDALRSADTLIGRRLTATGRYDHAREILLRGGSLGGVPGVYVVTPLRVAGSDTAVLVERGFVPATDGITADVDRLVEPGEVTVTGVARPIATGAGRPLAHAGSTTWARLDLDALRRTLPYPLLAVSIRQSPAPGLPEFPRRLEPPPIDGGPHLSYAIQWFLFAAMAAAFPFLVIARRPPSGGWS